MAVPTWAQQSLMWGYGSTTIDSKGQKTFNKSTANVSGFPTYSQDKYGTRTVVKPTENLTGYPVIYSSAKSDANRGMPDIWSELDATAVVQNLYGGGTYKTLQSSGNVTGWPTVWRKTVMGQTVNEFTIPGYTAPGTIAYDEEGFPGWNIDENGYLKMPKNVKNPYASAKMPQKPAVESLTLQAAPIESAYNSADARRRRRTLADDSF